MERIPSTAKIKCYQTELKKEGEFEMNSLLQFTEFFGKHLCTSPAEYEQLKIRGDTDAMITLKVRAWWGGWGEGL